MKTTQLVAAITLVAAGSFAVLAQAADVTRAQVKSEVATARAQGELTPERSYEVAPQVDHNTAKQARQGGLTRAEVRAETKQYLHDHPNRIAEEYEPFGQ